MGETAPASTPEAVKTAVHTGEKQESAPNGAPVTSIAVFPFENLSGSAVPLKSLRTSLSEELRRRGLRLLEEDALEKFMTRHRVRYTAGIDEQIARALKEETGVEGVLLTSIELYSEGVVPKIALTSRLVSTGDAPTILWMDGVGMAGDDHPGILNLGFISDPGLLTRKALGMVGESLAGRMAGKEGGRETEKAERKFRPKIAYRSDPEGGTEVHGGGCPLFQQERQKECGRCAGPPVCQGVARPSEF